MPLLPFVTGSRDPGARLTLKPGAPTAGHIDGAWWPRSGQLPVELPDVISGLSDQLGPVAVVGYHLNAWSTAPLAIDVAGSPVHLQGFTADAPASVIVIGRDGRRLTLLVVPPGVDEPTARRELISASAPGVAASDEPTEADHRTDRSMAEVAARLTRWADETDACRADTISRWVEEAAEQFSHAPIQAFVPILVEHIVRARLIASPDRSPRR